MEKPQLSFNNLLSYIYSPFFWSVPADSLALAMIRRCPGHERSTGNTKCGDMALAPWWPRLWRSGWANIPVVWDRTEVTPGDPGAGSSPLPSYFANKSWFSFALLPVFPHPSVSYFPVLFYPEEGEGCNLSTGCNDVIISFCNKERLLNFPTSWGWGAWDNLEEGTFWSLYRPIMSKTNPRFFTVNHGLGKFITS